MIYIPLISAVFVLFLGGFVLLKSKASSQSILFALFCITIFIWLFGTFMMFKSTSDPAAIFWDRFIYLGVIFLPTLMYHFSLVFTGYYQQKTILKYSYLLSCLFLISSRTDWFVKDLFRHKWGCHTIAQPLHHFFLFFFWLNVFIGAYNIYRFHSITTDRTKKKQSTYILLAFAALFLIGAPAYLPAYKIPVYPFPFLGALLFVGILSYTIAAHHLLDINIVFRKITGYSLAIASISIIYVIVLFLTSRLFGTVSNLTMLLIFITLAILFQPVYRWSTVRIDKLFFKGTLPDVSAEKEQVEEELRQEHERAIRNRLNAIKTMSYGLADRIRNDLVGIYSFMGAFPEKLKEVKDNLPADITDSLKNHYSASQMGVDKLIKLATEITNICKPQGYNPQRYDSKIIMDMADSAEKDLKSDMQNKEIKIEKVISGTPPATYFDKEEIKRVLWHLTQNSIHAIQETRKGLIKISVLGPVKRDEKDFLRIIVEDNGIGIPDENLENVFNPFFTTKGTVPLGLGLTICQFIINQHEGIIELEHSKMDEGTAIHIDLPIRTEPPKTEMSYEDILGQFPARRK